MPTNCRHYVFSALLCILLTWGAAACHAQVDCGQHGLPGSYTITNRRASAHNTPVTIDYAVFYTPEARNTQGGTAAIQSRIENAFLGANQLFANSGSAVMHRLVHSQELPLNNSSETLPEIGTELATGFNFFTVLDATQADTAVIIVNFQRPGGFANIPLTPGQAGRGGTIYLGLPNVSAGVLAHEIGHTLGAGHDYADGLQARFFIPPTYNYGNHFIGASSGNCYRTIMSALSGCRLAGFTHLPAVAANVFSNPLLLFEGTPTGDPQRADAVRMFSEFAPFVASARGPVQVPDPAPTSSPEQPDDGNQPGSEDPEDNPEEGDSLTLRLRKLGRGIIATGMCLANSGDALQGDRIELYLLNRQRQAERLVTTSSCNAQGKYRAKVGRGGRIQALNQRTGTRSRILRLRR